MGYANFLHDMNEWEERNREQASKERDEPSQSPEHDASDDRVKLVDSSALLEAIKSYDYPVSRLNWNLRCVANEDFASWVDLTKRPRRFDLPRAPGSSSRFWFQVAKTQGYQTHDFTTLYLMLSAETGHDVVSPVVSDVDDELRRLTRGGGGEAT